MSMGKKRIIIIEDDFFLIKVMQKKFEKEAFDVQILENGVDAIKKAIDFKPNIIVLDLVMPQKDGFETLRELRENYQTATIPIIVASNLASPEDIDKIKQFNVLKYFIKSNVDLEEIINFVKKCN